MYLFAGPERHADIKFFLQQLADKHNRTLEMHEWDILRGQEQDLTDSSVWTTVLDMIRQHKFHFIIVAPPCNTFSRARHNKRHPGPRPIRSWDYPRGFPWLKSTEADKAEQANLLVDHALEACTEAFLVGIPFLLEHPEQLGMAQGLIPASIWDWPEFHTLCRLSGLVQVAIFQCEFGAPTSKPTRLATSAVASIDDSALGKFQGPHLLSLEGDYGGPLPQVCPHHGHDHKLIGKAADGTWNTGPAAAYPPGLCEEIAKLFVNHLLAHETKGVRGGQEETNVNKKKVENIEDKKKQEGLKTPRRDQGEGDEPFHGRLERAGRDNMGHPITCRWMNKDKSFTDGGGLCSPGRWSPRDRGTGISLDRASWIDQLALKLRTFVTKHIPDLKRATFRLATGHMQEPPFSSEAVNQLREEWFSLLGGSDSLRLVTPHQPFYLFALAETLKRMGDEDSEIISEVEGDNYVTGRRVGVEDKIPPAPLVFRKKKKDRKYDESTFTPEACNYPSADESRDIIQGQFEEEERLGWMYPLSEAEARRRFGSKLRIASLAAIPKDEKSVRVLFDGTHSVQVNNEIQMEDQLEFPTPSELAGVMELSKEQDWGVVLAIAADINKAHRRFLHDERDHGYLCCRADSDSKVVWVNRVGTFGVACAALHFGRLAGAVFRAVVRMLKQQPCFQLLFADDLKWVGGGPSKYLDLWTMISGWIMMGTPFSWRKFRGGIALDYVGFWTDYSRFRLGLSEKRASWVIKTVQQLEQSGFVMMGRSFSELLGRLGFASQAVPWLKPMLGCLYAWDSVLTPFMAARLPGLVVITLQLVKERFLRGHFTAPCWSPQRVDGEVFRTDAKCETGLVVVAGWECAPGDGGAPRWFSFKVTSDEAPWIYSRGQDVQKMSTAAELLAVYAALHAFGLLQKMSNSSREDKLSLVAAGTDNLANEYLARKRMSTRLPLGLLLLQFYTKLWDNGLWMKINWRPREENQEADDLTNDRFEKFAADRRIEIRYKDLDTSILEVLQTSLSAFEETTTELRTGGVKVKGLTKRQKVQTKTDW